MTSMFRVVQGARLVASAAAQQASSQTSVVAHRATHHTQDLASVARLGLNQVVERIARDTVDGGKDEFDFDAPSSGRSPYESQLSSVATPDATSIPTQANPTIMNKASPEPTVSKPVPPSKPSPPPKPDYSNFLIHSDAAKKKAQEAAKAEINGEGRASIAKPESTSLEKETSEAVNKTEPSTKQAELTEILRKAEEKQQTDSFSAMDAMASENKINPHPSDRNTPASNDEPTKIKEGRAIPSSRAGRALGFASLGAKLAFGTASGWLSGGGVATEANANNLAATLCRMRGAALKLGQMLSIQDESLLPPALTIALQQVRQGADAMPNYQLIQQLESQLGMNWRDKFESFEQLPFAAASIGQVHRATVRDKETGTIRDVVVKVQYPGVARSIDSDLRNLTMIVKLTGMAPKGLFIENVIRVCRDELKVECNYINEMANQKKFRELIQSDPFLSSQNVYVPEVLDHLTTDQIITSEFAPGGTIDKAASLDLDERNRIGRAILYLTTKELFDWKLMQTDPNWGNFLYDPSTGRITLIDFGATRSYSKEFVDGYLRIVWASANQDSDTLMTQSRRMGFLTGEEKEILLEAHKQSGFTVGEPFWSNDPFDFRGSNLSTRMSAHTQVFLKHRLTPPPAEVYTLHRKLAGAYMLCIKLGSIFPCRDILEQTVSEHRFDDGMDNPIVNPKAAAQA